MLFKEGGLEFDFTNALNAEKFDEITYGGGMKQIDFIVELEDRYYFIEVKNPDNYIATQKAKNEFLNKVKNEKLKDDLIKKYKDSIIINWADNKCNNKPLYYITILEASYIDNVLKIALMDSIKKGLPLKLNKEISLKHSIIEGFAIMSVEEWNKRFVNFPIRKLQIN